MERNQQQKENPFQSSLWESAHRRTNAELLGRNIEPLCWSQGFFFNRDESKLTSLEGALDSFDLQGSLLLLGSSKLGWI